MIEQFYPHSPEDLQRPIHGFYRVIHAGNGTFVQARRVGLHAIIRINDDREDTCVNVTEVLEIENKISLGIMDLILHDFIEFLPNERLAWVMYSGRYCLFPEQEISQGAVRALNPFNPEIQNVIFDVHSHNSMPAYFSTQDDLDESSGFRIFIVMGEVDKRISQIRARVGIFGHFMEIPIDTVANIPPGKYWDGRI